MKMKKPIPAKTVRTLLKEIIKTEKTNRPYSDEKLSLLFKEREF